MFQNDEQANFYIFGIRRDNQFAVYLAHNEWMALMDWTKTYAIQPGQLNRLTVTAVGSHFTLPVNNQQVGEVDNCQVESGTAGVGFDMDANTEAAFEFSFFELRPP